MSDDFPYEDIVNLPHPQSGRHPQMPLESRAAQFAPFAALTGFDDAIGETGRGVEQPIILAQDALEELDAAIAAVMSEKLHHCISLLPWPEQEIIKEIYFDTKCEKEVAEKRGVPLTTLRYRRDGILRKLKKMMNS